MLATHHTTIDNTTAITASEETLLSEVPDISKLAVSFDTKDGSSSSEKESELFASILSNIDWLESSDSISPKEALAKKFLINRMKNYHSKVNPEDYNVVQSSNFLVYIPPKCRRYFTNIAYHQETSKDGGSLISLWSWYSGKDAETGRPSYVYVVSRESFTKMNDNYKSVESELSHLKFQIENWRRLAEDALSMGNEELATTYSTKVTELTSQKRSKMEQYVAAVFNNLSFFNTLSDGKKEVISLAKRFVTFKDPRNARPSNNRYTNKRSDDTTDEITEDVTVENGWVKDHETLGACRL